MAVSHHTLTLTGSAQALSGASNSPPVTTIRTVTLQMDTGATHAAYVGGSGVTSADYGVYIPSPAAAVPVAPMMLGETQSIHGHFKLSDIYVTGTNTEKVRLLVVTL